MTRASQHVPAAAASDVSQSVVSSRQAKKAPPLPQYRGACVTAVPPSSTDHQEQGVHHADQRVQRAHDLPHIPAVFPHLGRLPMHLRL
jgi:hypothetical protein